MHLSRAAFSSLQTQHGWVLVSIARLLRYFIVGYDKKKMVVYLNFLDRFRGL